MKPLASELRDQLAHMAVGSLAVAPVALHPAFWTGAITGVVCWAVREFTEWQGKPETWAKARRPWQQGVGSMRSVGSLRDLAGWTIGGALTGGVIA